MTPITPNEVNNGIRARSCDKDHPNFGRGAFAREAGSGFLAAGCTGGSEPLALRALSGQATTDEAARLGDGHSTDGCGFALNPNPIVALNLLSHDELVEYELIPNWQVGSGDPCVYTPPSIDLRNIVTALAVMALFGAGAFWCCLWNQRRAIGHIAVRIGAAAVFLAGAWMALCLGDMTGGAR